jgi:peptide/nickel transport system permease protein
MGGYILRRLASIIVLLILISMVTFGLFSLLPTDPAALTCGKSCTPAIIEDNRERLGLDQPVPVQYWEFVKGIFVGRTYGSGTAAFECEAPCLGYSFRRGEEVTKLLVDRFPVTAQLAIGAAILWLAIGVPAGILAARHRGRWIDKTATGLSLVAYSFPSFFLGYVLIFVFVIRLGWLPSPAYVAPTQDFGEFLQLMILPWLTMALLYAGFYTRLTRTQMLETMGEDYIRTARAKGLPERVVQRHGLRAGLTPLLTAFGIDLAGLLAGAVIAETVFSLPGIGRLAIDSVSDSDLPVITGTVLAAAGLILVANLVVDLLYGVVDPRVRLT